MKTETTPKENFTDRWHDIKRFLDDEMSIIPVNSKKVPAVEEWAPYQSRRMAEADLFSYLDKNDKLGIAFVCGKVSNNLLVVDVDSKYYPGIEIRILQDLKFFFPELYERLYIVRTPSGGLHIYVRLIDGTVPEGKKLAKRKATEEEIRLKPKEKVKTFIETRGEKQYAVTYPSTGYTIIKANSIPELNQEAFDTLLTFCEAYNELLEETRPYRPSKRDAGIYDENPFEDYNNRVDPVELMESFGWSFFKQNHRYIWFTRPGKAKSVSASFNNEKRCFYVFTSSTELEPAKGYLPATLLSNFQFNGDKKKTYAYLVQNGYGKVKPSIEEKTIKRTAQRGGKLPANFSKEAQEKLSEEIQQMDQVYPFGIFWREEEDGTFKISREGVRRVAEAMGFNLVTTNIPEGELVKVEGYTVSRVTSRQFYDALREYIKEEDQQLKDAVLNALESFIQRSGKFTIERLPIIDSSRFVTDDRATSFKFYRNGYLAITALDWYLMEYDTLPGLIWSDEIQDRDFAERKEGLFTDFLNNALQFDMLKDYISTVFGYLAHGYKDETTGYIVAAVEQVEDPKFGGGSGKNVLFSLFRYITTFASTPGSQMQYNEKFLQSWNGERILCISDPDKRFNWSFLKELSTGVGKIKKLWRNEESIPFSRLPKFVVTTNYASDIADGGVKRRIVHLEFTDFFTRTGGIDVHYQKHFPKDWTADDWANFDTVMAQSVQAWLANGLKIQKVELTQSGWLKQFDQKNGQTTREFIQQHIDTFLKQGFISTTDFWSAYDTFCSDYGVPLIYQKKGMKMNDALSDWCEHFGIVYEKDVTQKNEYNCAQKGKRFTIAKADEEEDFF